MFGIVILAVYAVLMIGVTLMFTRKTTDAEGFHVADRRIGSAIAAMSIAATWIWAPSLFTSSEMAYTRGIPGMFLVYGTECAVPDPVYPLCKKDSGAVPGGHHLDRLHGGALSFRQVKGVYSFQLGALAVLSTAVQLLAGERRWPSLRGCHSGA